MTLLEPLPAENPEPSKNDGGPRGPETVDRILDRSTVYDAYLDAIEDRVREYQENPRS